MNKNCYRLVFNSARGFLMAVAEIVVSRSKASGQSRRDRTDNESSHSGWRQRRFTFALLIGLAGPGAWAGDAGITPSGNAGQRPIMDAAPNGVPIVNIAPPSRGGVSQNHYQDFNVQPSGVILNNSSNNINTQLSGWIAGNPQLGPIPAKIIVNEVLGPNASQLLGVLEVAGQKADVVIANPNGIFCDGCGTLNASRLTLSTGQPQYDSGGRLDTLNVQQGLITIGQGGLTASALGQLDLLARGLVLDGEIWVQRLNAIAGANQVEYGTLQHSLQESMGSAPRFAVDVHDLGGMYANQVYLIATEKGLGVNSTGRIAALDGALTLSVAGDLVLKDSYAKQGMALMANGSTQLNGQTQSGAGLSVETTGAFANAGELTSSGGAVISADSVRNAGRIINSEAGALQLASNGLLSNSGIVASAGDLGLQAVSIDDQKGSLLSQKNLRLQSHEIALNGSQLMADGDLVIKADVGALNSRAEIQSGGSAVLSAATSLTSSGNVIALGDITLSGDAISNAATIQANGSLTANAVHAVDNQNSHMLAGRNLSVSGTQINNRSGVVTANGLLQVQADGLDNNNGTITGDTVRIKVRNRY